MTIDRPPLDTNIFGPDSKCFGCSPDHPFGLHLRCDRVGPPGDEAVVTEFFARADYQGPPGIMHGGLVMALADELAAWTVVGLAGRFGFTAAASVRFTGSVKTGSKVFGRGSLIGTSAEAASNARLVKVKVSLAQKDPDGKLGDVFAGDFTFALLTEASAAKLLGGSLPEAWRKFARGAATE